MRKAVAVTAIIATLLVASIPQNLIVKGNPIGLEGGVIIHSPKLHPYINIEPNVNFSFTYYLPKHMPQVKSFSYSLDGHMYFTLPSSEELKVMNFFYEHKAYSVNKTLDNLADGTHKLRIYSHLSNGTINKIADIEFIVNTSFVPQNPSIISPENQTYNSNQIPLIYTTDNIVNSSSYSIDCLDNYLLNWTYFSGNTTLCNLTDGTHMLRLNVFSESQKIISHDDYKQTVFFTIDTTAPSPTPTPKPIEIDITSLIAVFVAVLSIALGSLVYFKKLRLNK